MPNEHSALIRLSKYARRGVGDDRPRSEDAIVQLAERSQTSAAASSPS